MSDELEKRLRELVSRIGERNLTSYNDVVREAARIGAEIEREECARICDEAAPVFDVPLASTYPRTIAVSIRARGAR